MMTPQTYVVDIETNGFHSTKIHVMSVGYKDLDGKWKIKSTADYDVIIKIMSNPKNTIVGHNFKLFDAIELERVLNFKIKATIIDTLPLSWVLYPNRKIRTFGLESFGLDYGIEKPSVEDWENITYEEVKNRCEEDVKINVNLWVDLERKLLELYGKWEEAQKFINYLMFKMDVLAMQRKLKCSINVDTVIDTIQILTPISEEKEKVLQESMLPGKVIRVKPKLMIKQDGNFSSLGRDWIDTLEELKLPKNTTEIRGIANPKSSPQIKEWLFSLGWKPIIFNDGANGKVPQIRDKHKQLCKSVLNLAEKSPAIEALDGLTVINHRIAILKSFLGNVNPLGEVVSGISGFTNTLRVRHIKPIVNLPKVTNGIKKAMEGGMSKEDAIANNLRDGQIIRECIVAKEGELCGSDIKSLEDQTKRHYMFPYDPEYVKEQMQDGYDPHLALAVSAGDITEEQVAKHLLFEKTNGEQGTSYKGIRDIYKEVNYSCVYGVGATKLAGITGKTTKESKEYISYYWNRNWSVKHLPRDITTKTVGEQIWLLNPVNSFWYSLRSEKDIFSTLNQGTGAFVFDAWVKFMTVEGLYPFLQYHDEVLLYNNKKDRKDVKEKLERSMEKVNTLLKLNVNIEVDVKFGNNYSEVH